MVKTKDIWLKNSQSLLEHIKDYSNGQDLLELIQKLLCDYFNIVDIVDNEKCFTNKELKFNAKKDYLSLHISDTTLLGKKIIENEKLLNFSELVKKVLYEYFLLAEPYTARTFAVRVNDKQLKEKIIKLESKGFLIKTLTREMLYKHFNVLPNVEYNDRKITIRKESEINRFNLIFKSVDNVLPYIEDMAKHKELNRLILKLLEEALK